MTRPSPTLELAKPPPPPHVGSDRATQAAESSGSAIYMTPSSMAFVVYETMTIIVHHLDGHDFKLQLQPHQNCIQSEQWRRGQNTDAQF